MSNSDTKVKVTLTLAEDLYEEFADRGKKFSRTPEKEIMEHLRRTRDFTATAPIYFNDEQRGRLQKAMGHLMADAEDVLAKLGNLISLKVGEIQVPLSDRLQVRLRSRVFRGHTMDDVVKKEVTEGLERFTGIRPH